MISAGADTSYNQIQLHRMDLLKLTHLNFIPLLCFDLRFSSFAKVIIEQQCSTQISAAVTFTLMQYPWVKGIRNAENPIPQLL